MTPRKLVRVTKARSSGLLACGHYVLRGNVKVWVDGRWICRPCRLDQIDELDRTMREPARPSGRGTDIEGET